MGLLDPPGFRRNRHGHLWMHLQEGERTLLTQLLDQLGELLAPPEPEQPVDPLEELVGIDPAAVRPADPALARLFPDAYSDPEAADEFRRFTQRDLRSTKLEHLDLARATLARKDPTRLSDEEAAAWLGTLNDLRLTLGTRLAVSQDGPEPFLELAEDDPRRGMYLVYDWLTYHQDRLIRALDRGMPR
ncbi:MAG: DUF2017 domain-containing protein [Candidatus Nanopelagicales bacterium]|jgi:hypothetical protein|nr:DUF2017 domain-containing protein [Candidatus Nanopelagicales bacterium]